MDKQQRVWLFEDNGRRRPVGTLELLRFMIGAGLEVVSTVYVADCLVVVFWSSRTPVQDEPIYGKATQVFLGMTGCEFALNWLRGQAI